MYKNTTLLVTHFQLNRNANMRFLYRAITPLFELSVYDYSQNVKNKTVMQIFRQPQLVKNSPQTKDFNKILILHSNVYSNARRMRLINIKRSAIIEYLNKNCPKQFLYYVTLNKANQFVPVSEVIQQLKKSLQKMNQKQIKKKYDQSNYFDTNTSILKLLNNLNLNIWSEYLKYRFQNKNLKGLRLIQLQQSYVQLQITNIYKIKYSQQPEALYEDLKDFDKMLNKFNFIRFFYTTGANNVVRAEKNCEALIKMIKWKTKQTQQYLLFLIRNNSWQRFCLYVQNFVFFYQRDFLNLKQNNIMNR